MYTCIHVQIQDKHTNIELWFLYYMAVVDKAEEDKKVFHDKCLQLMRVHVEQQRQRVQEASERNNDTIIIQVIIIIIHV